MDYRSFTYKQMIDTGNKFKQQPQNECDLCKKEVKNIIAVGDNNETDYECCYRCGMKGYMKPSEHKALNQFYAAEVKADNMMGDSIKGDK